MSGKLNLCLWVLGGALLGASGVWFLKTSGQPDGNTSNGEPQPLYWVAPMDANYRRDQPGQSLSDPHFLISL